MDKLETADLIPITRPYLDREEESAAQRVIRSGWLMSGPEQDQFEKDFGAFVHAPHARAVSSCTAGLQLALRGVGVETGDVVITVSHSYIASANAARFVGAEPVFVDIDPRTLNMDPVKLAALLDEEFEMREGGLWFQDVDRLSQGESPLSRCTEPKGKLAAILVVHQVGMPADMVAIMKLADAHNVPVIEDAACAIGSEISLDHGESWQPIGKPIGAASCFSFHPRKVITTGEGGMVTTADETLADNVGSWRQHGMDRSTADRHSAETYVDESYRNSSGNFRMTDIQAAIGIEQVKRIPKIIDRRRAIAKHYWDGLSDINVLALPQEPDYARTNYQSYIVRLPNPECVPVFRRSLKAQGVDTRPGIMNAHLEQPYAAIWPQGTLPESEAAQAASVILPLFPAMDDPTSARVVEAVRSAVEELA